MHHHWSTASQGSKRLEVLRNPYIIQNNQGPQTSAAHGATPVVIVSSPSIFVSWGQLSQLCEARGEKRRTFDTCPNHQAVNNRWRHSESSPTILQPKQIGLLKRQHLIEMIGRSSTLFHVIFYRVSFVKWNLPTSPPPRRETRQGSKQLAIAIREIAGRLMNTKCPQQLCLQIHLGR